MSKRNERSERGTAGSKLTVDSDHSSNEQLSLITMRLEKRGQHRSEQRGKDGGVDSQLR